MLEGGVAVLLGLTVAADGVSVDVGDCGGRPMSTNTSVASATLTRPSLFTSEPSQVLGPPKRMASTASTSAWLTCPSQLASPGGVMVCARLAVADSTTSRAAHTHRISCF